MCLCRCNTCESNVAFTGRWPTLLHLFPAGMADDRACTEDEVATQRQHVGKHWYLLTVIAANQCMMDSNVDLLYFLLAQVLCAFGCLCACAQNVELSVVRVDVDVMLPIPCSLSRATSRVISQTHMPECKRTSLVLRRQARGPVWLGEHRYETCCPGTRPCVCPVCISPHTASRCW